MSAHADGSARLARLVGTLRARGVGGRCPACAQDATRQALSGDGSVTTSVLGHTDKLPPGVRTQETILLACMNCGFVSEHMLHYLEAPGVVYPTIGPPAPAAGPGEAPTLRDLCHLAAAMAVLGRRSACVRAAAAIEAKERDAADRLADELLSYLSGREERDLNREAESFGFFSLGDPLLKLYERED